MLYLEVPLEMLLHDLLLCVLIVNTYCESIGVFDDSVLFDISWPGFLPEDTLEADSKVEVRHIHC